MLTGYKTHEMYRHVPLRLELDSFLGSSILPQVRKTNFFSMHPDSLINALERKRFPQYISLSLFSCADVTVQGVKSGRLPAKTIQIYNFPGHKKGVTFRGDGVSLRAGAGPIKSEIAEATRKKSL